MGVGLGFMGDDTVIGMTGGRCRQNG